MGCNLTEEELWSGLDSGASEMDEHLRTCGRCRDRAAQFRAGIRALTQVSTPTDLRLPEIIGSYRIHRRLGEGGMGLVYEGEQQSPQRRVAIKVVRGGQCGDEYLVRLFQREVQALGRLKHPAIASIYEAGRTDDGQHFFVMELVPGMPLTRYAKTCDVPLAERLELFRRICEAAHYAHQRGVIHCDLKPTNILVDPEGNPKILDFGLARITEPGVGPASVVMGMGRMGTPAYMSPEEARGRREDVDVRTDVYSLGVIFYELLTGALPYTVNKEDWAETFRVICEEPPRRSPLRTRGLRGDLETIALKALAKEPVRRYQNASLLAEDIGRHLTGQPILARRANPLYRLGKLAVRHKLRLMILILFLAAVGGKYWLDAWTEQAFRNAMLAVEQGDMPLALKAQALGDKYLEDLEYSKAEAEYREALRIYDRRGLDDPRRTGKTLLGLTVALMSQADPQPSVLDEADSCIADAVRIFEEAGPEWSSELRRAREAWHTTLLALRELYGPGGKRDKPKILAGVNADIKEVKAKLAETEGEPK